MQTTTSSNTAATTFRSGMELFHRAKAVREDPLRSCVTDSSSSSARRYLSWWLRRPTAFARWKSSMPERIEVAPEVLELVVCIITTTLEELVDWFCSIWDYVFGSERQGDWLVRYFVWIRDEWRVTWVLGIGIVVY